MEAGNALAHNPILAQRKARNTKGIPRFLTDRL
jgi:hypothetical protein